MLLILFDAETLNGNTNVSVAFPVHVKHKFNVLMKSVRCCRGVASIPANI